MNSPVRSDITSISNKALKLHSTVPENTKIVDIHHDQTNHAQYKEPTQKVHKAAYSLDQVSPHTSNNTPSTV